MDEEDARTISDEDRDTLVAALHHYKDSLRMVNDKIAAVTDDRVVLTEKRAFEIEAAMSGLTDARAMYDEALRRLGRTPPHRA